ncbi:MAG: TSUP family transporter [Acidobacteriota bacterium]
MDGGLGYLILFGAGLLAGTLNVLAGGGSFLTLPMLILLGLPPGIANGTNRVGILLQNVGAIWSFNRDNVLDWRSARWAALPATAGAALGTWLALWISDDGFQRILAFLMVVITLFSFWTPKPPAEGGTRRGMLAAGFFVVGIYGGFVQAGVGFLILAATTFAGLDLVRGNAVKVLSVFCFTSLSLAIFASQGRVDWTLGLVLAAGTVLGGVLGARLTVLRGHRWLRAFVTVVVVLFAVKLWFG